MKDKQWLIIELKKAKAVLEISAGFNRDFYDYARAVDDAIDIIKRLTVCRTRKIVPADARIPQEKTEEFARNEIRYAMANFLMDSGAIEVECIKDTSQENFFGGKVYEGRLTILYPEQEVIKIERGADNDR